MYLDSAYLAKFYVNEPDAARVRDLIRNAVHICSSALALIEVTCVFHRHVREGSLSKGQGRELMEMFRSHAEDELWNLVPITDALLQRTTSLIHVLSPAVPLRAGDAIHLATAIDVGETEIWTNDRHLLSAAPHFGIAGRCL